MGTHKDLMSRGTLPSRSPEDRLVLCSDGLHEMVTDAEICAIAGTNEHREACEQMVRLALDRISSTTLRSRWWKFTATDPKKLSHE
jgi:serine/threonine protein phosphatase PrpC